MLGVINLLKPPGMTSHDAVAVVRRLLGVRRIGHAGTLDPGAAGVLPVAVGRATRLMRWLLQADKAYRAEMTLGIETDTLDAQGKTTAMNTDFRLAPARLVDAMYMFLGHVMQVPPMVSSVKVGGERLYRAARRGEEVERAARAVRIDEIAIRKVWPDGALDLEFGSRVLFDVTCSKGTYIRSLVADIGKNVGCGAHLSFLVRTRSGPFVLEESHTLEEIRDAVEEGALDRVLLPPETALPRLPRVDLDPGTARRLCHGNPVPVTEGLPDDEYFRVHVRGGRMVAVGQRAPGPRPGVRPVVVLVDPEEELDG